MVHFRCIFVAAAFIAVAAPAHRASSQTDKKEQKEKKEGKAAKSDSAKAAKTYATKFFDIETPLEATLITNIDRIRHDKGNKVVWRPATWAYTGADGKPVVVPIKIRTRGIWRLNKCDFPPLRLDFAGKTTKGGPYEGLDKPKLVSFCKNDDTYEQYVIQEAMLYRAYNKLTDATHRGRLIKVTYVDSASGKTHAVRWANMLEEPDAVAARLGGKLLKQVGARQGDLEPEHALLVGLFEYFVANTDYSINGLHNVELFIKSTGEVVPVAYDFDFSGAVNARYATADPSLSINRVRDRLFRGYCGSTGEYGPIFAKFNAQKDAIYGLYHDDVGKLLRPNIVDETLKYFDEFYKTINDKRSANREILENCKD
jgi:hypothetical protein